VQLRNKVIVGGLALTAMLAVAPKIKAVSPTMVQVVNALDQWVPVGNVFEPGLNPVELVQQITQDGAAITAYTVPAGKRLVIRAVSMDCYNTSTPIVSGYVNSVPVNGAVTGFSYPMLPYSVALTNGTYHTTANAQVLQYADPQATVSVAVQSLAAFNGHTGLGVNGGCVATVSGYLVTLPLTITAPIIN
jgi:hypothetical protein